MNGLKLLDMEKNFCDCDAPGMNLEKNGHTASCNRYNRNRESSQSKPVKAKKPVNKVSDKMAKALKE